MFDLNIWWNLNILRDTSEGGEQSNLVLLSPAGLSQAYASLLLRFHCPLCRLVGMGVSGISPPFSKSRR